MNTCDEFPFYPVIIEGINTIHSWRFLSLLLVLPAQTTSGMHNK